jgi:hypothetical protein
VRPFPQEHNVLALADGLDAEVLLPGDSQDLPTAVMAPLTALPGESNSAMATVFRPWLSLGRA